MQGKECMSGTDDSIQETQLSKINLIKIVSFYLEHFEQQTPTSLDFIILQFITREITINPNLHPKA